MTNIRRENLFTRAVHHEAITGTGKFKTREGTATHVEIGRAHV